MPGKQKILKTCGKPNEAYRGYKEIAQEYAFDGSIFAEDDARVAAVKYIIDNKLNQVDKTLILLYADCQSLRKLGKRMGFSQTTMHEEIRRIKRIILEEYKKLQMQMTEKEVAIRNVILERVAVLDEATKNPILSPNDLSYYNGKREGYMQCFSLIGESIESILVELENEERWTR